MRTALIIGTGIILVGFLLTKEEPTSLPEINPKEATIAEPKLGVATIAEIELAQEAYFQANRQYLQIRKGNKLTDGRSVQSELGIKIPDNIYVNISWDSKGNHGYTIYNESPTGTNVKGYGLESTKGERFYSIEPTDKSASTTP